MDSPHSYLGLEIQQCRSQYECLRGLLGHYLVLLAVWKGSADVAAHDRLP